MSVVAKARNTMECEESLNARLAVVGCSVITEFYLVKPVSPFPTSSFQDFWRNLFIVSRCVHSVSFLFSALMKSFLFFAFFFPTVGFK